MHNENPEHTNRHARLAKDLESVITITNSLVPGVTKGSVRDCTRLGRYSPSRDRPLLVKFNCAHEASSILANRSKLKTLPGISIKPDMSPQEKATESILLKERYSLISEGVSRKSIKIVGSSLFVNNVKHGSVIDLKYSCTNHRTSRQPSITILSSTGTDEDTTPPANNTATAANGIANEDPSPSNGDQ